MKPPFAVSLLLIPAVILFSRCGDSGLPPIETPDTTSHSFAWEVTALGDGSSSVLRDAAILSDTLVYLAGDVYRLDSLGNYDPDAFNLVSWNGSTWNPMRIPFLGPCSAVDYPPLYAIWAFSNSRILLTNGGSIVTYDGTSASMDCGMNSLLAGAMTKIWAFAPSDIYAVGNSGTIVHSANSTWQKAESGTTVDLQDITGTADGSSIWACGYSSDLSQSALIHSAGGAWSTVWSSQTPSTPPYGQLVLTVWAGSANLYVGATDGVYRAPLDGSTVPQRVLALPSVPHRIRGSGENNIAVACDDGSVWHYNGATWKQLVPPEQLKPLYGIAVSANLIVAVGFDATTTNWRGRVVVGRRR